MAVIKKFHERTKNKRRPWRANAVVAKRRDSESGGPPDVSIAWLTAWRVITTLVIGLFLSFVLPERLTEQILTRKVAKLAAPLTGIEYGKSQRDHITVLIVDRESLDKVGESWPAKYRYYARLLLHVAQYHPKAIFIDLILAHKDDEATLGNLKSAIHTISNPYKCLHGEGQCSPVNVFLGASREGGQLHISPELDELDGVTKVALEYYPDDVDRIAWKYPMTYGPAVRSGGPEEPTQIRSAALAIYEVAFGGLDDERRHKRLPEMALTWGFDRADHGLLWKYSPHEEELSTASEEVQQSARPAPLTVAVAHHGASQATGKDASKANAEKEAKDTPSNDESEKFYCDASQSGFWQLLRAELHAALPPQGLPLCVFHRTVHAWDIENMSAAEEDKAFANRVVMIGTSIKYSNDIVTSRSMTRSRVCTCMRWRSTICSSRQATTSVPLSRHSVSPMATGASLHWPCSVLPVLASCAQPRIGGNTASTPGTPSALIICIADAIVTGSDSSVEPSLC
jgi:CHASE2 domain-containing sensor protein